MWRVALVVAVALLLVATYAAFKAALIGLGAAMLLSLVLWACLPIRRRK